MYIYINTQYMIFFPHSSSFVLFVLIHLHHTIHLHYTVHLFISSYYSPPLYCSSVHLIILLTSIILFICSSHHTDPTETQITLFHDPQAGGFFSTPSTTQLTPLRLKEGMDSSLPSINALAAANLFHLASLLDDDTYASLATGTVNAFEAELLQYPWLFPGMLVVVAKARLGGYIGRPVPTREVKYKERREKARTVQ